MWNSKVNVAVKNKYEDIKIADVYSFVRTISKFDVLRFASLSGDFNPLHVDEKFGKKSKFGTNVVHGMLTASLFSTLIGMYCPGKNSLYLGQTLEFKAPLFYGDTVEVKGTILNKVD